MAWCLTFAMRIGVIADTHGLLRSEAEECLTGVDHIIHAGDIGSPDIVPRLRAIAPTTAIKGNVDAQEWANAFPEHEALVLAGRSIYVLHDIGDLTFDPAKRGIAVVIAGHSHRPTIETVNGVLFLNPGSAGRRRFKLPVTLATMELIGDAIRPEIHVLVTSRIAGRPPTDDMDF
jgi:putative phosphoesterase